jgi:hypothetical protein
MALCCLLIETLQRFRESPPAKAFLLRPAFGGIFDDDIADRFISGIRNGILHEAETRKWVIRRIEPADKMVMSKEDGFVLNRSLFYAAVKKEFASYLGELRHPVNMELRQTFKDRMDDVCKKT